MDEWLDGRGRTVGIAMILVGALMCHDWMKPGIARAEQTADSPATLEGREVVSADQTLLIRDSQLSVVPWRKMKTLPL